MCIVFLDGHSVFVYLYITHTNTREEIKRKLLLKKLKEIGCELCRNGADHDIWINANGKKFPVPRHPDIRENLAKKILAKDALKGD